MPYIVNDNVAGLVGRSDASRGVGKIWRAGDTHLSEAASGATDHHLTNAAGVKFYVVPDNGRIRIPQDFGLSAGANIGDALEKAWDLLAAGDGGAIEIASGDWLSDNRTFAQSNRVIQVTGQGSTTRVSPSNPTAGTFMWDFEGTDASVARLEVRDLVIEGSGASFNGVRVQPSNYIRFERVQGRNIAGTAFKFLRHYNSLLDIETYFCGDQASGRFALVMTGDPVSGQSFNDCTFSGASEQDELGWLFEGCSGILRTRNRFKLHGSNTAGKAVRGMQIHRCSDFDIALDLTRGCTASGFVHVSDGNTGDGITLGDAHANAPNICQGALDVRVLKNFTVAGPGTFDLVTIDMAATNSVLVLRGQLEEIAAPTGGGAYNYIGLAAPGWSGVFLDLSGLVPTNIDPDIKDGTNASNALIDDRRTYGAHVDWAYAVASNRIEGGS